MLKKVTCGLIAALALLFVFAACGSGSYDDSALKDQLSKLQTQLDELKESNKTLAENLDQVKLENEELAGILDGIAGNNGKIYQLGETFTYKSNGVEMFSVKIEDLDELYYQFTIKNFRMPTNEPERYITFQYFANGASRLVTLSPEQKIECGETKSQQSRKLSFSNTTYLTVGFPCTYSYETGSSQIEHISTLIPYAIFQIA